MQLSEARRDEGWPEPSLELVPGTPGSPGSPVQAYLERVHRDCAQLDAGAVATYIPALAEADASWFGICVVTADGFSYEVGDTALPFTIQSISKPFVYGMALEDCGPDAVLARVGVEPTGDPFNSIAVDEASNRPFNPMVNAGAIVTTGLVRGRDTHERLTRIVSGFESIVGHPVRVDEEVFASERATGDRNRAIAFLMRNFGMLDGDVEAVLDLYFRQCSLLVTCRDLAVSAATLANGGINPLTGTRALDERYVENVLSVVQTCGMYDYAGEWTYTVGLPAKSGVSGGVMAVLPGQLGIGVWSPPLDARGNSVRGIEVCQRLARDLALHPFRAHPTATAAVRGRYRGDRVRSTRVRPEREERVLEAGASRLLVHELQGDLYFATAEAVVRAVLDDLDGADIVVLDGHRVGHVDAAARSLLDGLRRSLHEAGVTLVLAALVATDDTVSAPDAADGVVFDDVELALEWCEDRLLADRVGSRDAGSASLADQELLQGLADTELAEVAHAVIRQEFGPGEIMMRAGDAADRVHLVLAGKVSVRLPADGHHRARRVAAFGPGVAVGDGALLDGARRSADVHADEPTVTSVLTLDALARLRVEHPALAAKIYANFTRILSDRLRRTNTQLRALQQ
jgi:glutaminase